MKGFEIMYLIKQNGKWRLANQKDYNKLINSYNNMSALFELDNINDIIDEISYSFKGNEIVYVIQGREIVAFSREKQLTCDELVAMGFETFKGYELVKKPDAMFLIRGDIV